MLFSIIQWYSFVDLDEVEAALDEANVKRFGDYLNRFDRRSVYRCYPPGTMSAPLWVTVRVRVSKIVSVVKEKVCKKDIKHLNLPMDGTLFKWSRTLVTWSVLKVFPVKSERSLFAVMAGGRGFCLGSCLRDRVIFHC